MKVALSVAVIRSKPSGLTGRQYAEQLFSRSQHLQLHWRNRSVELQQEVLHLKQQLIQTRTSTDGAATTCDHVQLQPGMLVIELCVTSVFIEFHNLKGRSALNFEIYNT